MRGSVQWTEPPATPHGKISLSDPDSKPQKTRSRLYLRDSHRAKRKRTAMQISGPKDAPFT
jgi:hypothetical protein